MCLYYTERLEIYKRFAVFRRGNTVFASEDVEC
jgi:hypothetical protein